jgi:hypothetical protein
MNEAEKINKQQGNGVLQCVSERYLLIEWIQGHPIIDGAKYADTKQELMDYLDSLPKLPKSLVEYTICRIYNVR